MSPREPIWRRTMRLIRPDAGRDVDEELAFHLAMREEEFRARGESADAARLHARERFGDVADARKGCITVDTRMHQAATRMRVMEELGQDARFAARTLRKRPGFAAAVIVTLALGIGATTAIFAVINAVLLQAPAQVRRPQELVAVYTSDFSGPLWGSNSHPDYEDFSRATDVFAGLASYETRQFSTGLRGSSQLRNAEVVSGNYFEVLGVPMQHGRAITPDEDNAPGTHPVAVISDALWRRSADADPGIVGEPVRLNNRVFTIVGVAAPRFTGAVRGATADIWVPRSMSDALEFGNPDLVRRDSRGIALIGRLAPGVTRDAAQARLDGLAAQLFAEYPQAWRDVTGSGRHVTLLSEKDSRVRPDQRGRVVGFLGILMGAVTLLFLLCSANVATLLVARGASRSREIAVRLSMGAGRGRLIRQLMTENLILAVTGGLAGLWVASKLTVIILALLEAAPGDLDTGIHGPVLIFALAVTLGGCLLFGLVPSLRASRADLQRELKGDNSSAKVGRRRLALRDVLVTIQVAISLVLLAGAGLLLQSLRNTQRVDVGFDHQRLVMISPSLGLVGYDSARAREYYRSLQSQVSAMPGVSAAVIGRAVPLGGGVSRSGISIENYVRRQGEELEFGINRTGPGYFQLMGIPLTQGRDFSEADNATAPGAAIVNETFVKRFWPSESPLGKRFQLGSGPRWFTIVGVARDIHYGRVAEEARPFFYLPYAQYPSLHMVMHVRTAGAEAPVMESLKGLLKRLDPEVPVELGSMEERIARLLGPQRTAATLLAMLGGVGLLLAGTGLYGVLAFSVAQRRREFGIRMALGATAGRVRRMVVRQGVLLAVVGVAGGLVIAALLTRLAKGMLFGVGASDPVTFASVVVMLIGVAALASWVPARKVTSVNPADVIRND